MYQGDYTPGKLVVFNFNTASFIDGSPITLGGTPVLSVYKNSTTESTTGITLTVDYDSRTGMQHVAIDTSADGTFYASGNDFDVIITTGTVGGTSVVGRKVGSFSLSNRSALRPATADRTLVVDAAGLADANTVKVGPSGSGTAQTAGDIPGKTNSLTFTVSNVVDANPTKWASGTIPTPNVTGVPIVDNKYLLGTIYSTPATAGIMDVNVKNWRNQAVPTTIISGTPIVDVGGWGGNASGIAVSTHNSYPFVSVATFSKVDNGAESAYLTVTDLQAITIGAFVGNGTAAIGVSAGGKITEVVLTDTLTTYTGNTPQTANVATLISHAFTYSTSNLPVVSTGSFYDTSGHSESGNISLTTNAVITLAPYLGSTVHNLVCDSSGFVTFNNSGIATSTQVTNAAASTNVAKINNHAVTGSGTSGDPWQGS